MASLKGPKHGGANIKVTQMFEDMKKKVHDWEDKDESASICATCWTRRLLIRRD